MSERIGHGLASAVFAVATVVVIVAASVAPFLSPAYVAFEQGRAGATAWTGFSEAELRTATDAILADLVLGPPQFDVEVRGEPVLNDRERSHMRDVRGVFLGLWAAAALSLVTLVAAFVASRRDVARARLVRHAARRGAIGLAVTVVGLGAAALLAFDALFEAFHRLFFAGGTYTFDPATERLVQLFPYTFWLETALAVGAVIVVLSAAVAFVLRADGAPAATAARPAAHGAPRRTERPAERPS